LIDLWKSKLLGIFPADPGLGGLCMKAKTFGFGPFELDPAQQQLRRRGIRLKLPASRIRLLLLLVKRRGELVSREEISACLWTDAKAVDVITGINTAMNHLRSQLGDDPAAPKYIETVIGSGYRFIAKVAEIEAPAESVSEIPQPPTLDREEGSVTLTEAAKPDAPGLEARATGQQESSPRKTKKIIAIAFAAAILLALCIFFFPIHRPVPQVELEMNRVTRSGDIQYADISPDGKYVAYVRETGGEQSLWLKQLATDRVLQLATLETFTSPGLAFSPDGNYVYFVRKELLGPSGELYRVPFLGGSPAKVLDGISGAPAISPDGRTVAFVRSTLVTHGKDSIVTASIDGSGERILATYDAPGIHFNRVAWTPDGQSLVYPLQSDLMVIPASGGTAQQLRGDPWTNIDDIWNLPTGRDLIVAGQLAGSTLRQIVEVSLPDGKTHPISHDLSSYVTVRTTADGKVLLTVQRLTLSNIQILAPGTEGTGSEPLPLSIENQNYEGVEGLGWTQDGKIIYLSGFERGAELMETDSNGSNPRRLSLSGSQAARYSNPAVSPRGDFIAVTRWSEHDRANIWRMDMNSGNEKRLTDGTQDFPPSIAPDGQWVVYASVQGDKSVLMKVSSHGGPAIRLTDYDADYPSVSPDGKWIACSYIAHPNQRASLAIVPIAGGPPAKVFPLPETATPPPLAWTPDGRAVSFINNVNGVGNVWQQPAAGGEAAPITHFASDKLFNFQWSRDGRLALARGTETTDVVLIRNFRGAR
jgi:Tol biopolymer transport system component/DNA-binding winged helix-turn-helix (wHTH) protein